MPEIMQKGKVPPTQKHGSLLVPSVGCLSITVQNDVKAEFVFTFTN